MAGWVGGWLGAGFYRLILQIKKILYCPSLVTNTILGFLIIIIIIA